MKYIYLLLAVALLASCNETATNLKESSASATATDTAMVEEVESATDTTTQDIDTEIANIPAEIEIDDTVTTENEDTGEYKKNMIKLETKYANPAQEVNLQIAYRLDSNGKIVEITAGSDNYDGVDYLNENMQVLVGKTLKEAVDADIAGGSLTIPAVKELLKNNMF